MKNLIILFLLFSTVYLDSEDYGDYDDYDDYYDLPEELKKYQEDEETCLKAEYNEESCFKVTLQTKNSQCCLLEFITPKNVSRNCSLLGGSLEGLNNEQVNSPMLKELAGYQIYALEMHDVIHMQKYKCKDGSVTISYGYDEYSDEEISILKSEKNCLNYFYGLYHDYFYKEKIITEDDCFQADMLQTSKDGGIECVYFEYQFKFLDGSSKT